jgi:protein translocase SecG subunit
MHILVGILTALLVLLSLGLTFLVTIQTPKSEGFGGGVQNTPGGSFRGKAGYDEMLSAYTKYLAVVWFAAAFLLALVSEYVRTHAL